MDMNPNSWGLEIKITASSFDGLIGSARSLLKQVENAKSFGDLKTIPSGAGGGGGGHFISVHIKATAPIEHRIAALRKEADELEASLLKGSD